MNHENKEEIVKVIEKMMSHYRKCAEIHYNKSDPEVTGEILLNIVKNVCFKMISEFLQNVVEDDCIEWIADSLKSLIVEDIDYCVKKIKS